MATGVTPQGFVAKTVESLLSDIEAAELLNVDAQLDTSPEEPIGQLNGIFAEKLAELWELAAVAYNGYSRDGAENVQLDNVNGLTGTTRLTAKPSFTIQTCVFSQVGSYVAGALVANVSGQPSVQFANGENVTVALSGGTYQATLDGGQVLATSGSLPITVPGIKFLCLVDGPTVANSGTLATITTPVTGWTSTTNPLDATLGSLEEQDTPYRLRGEQEIAAAGSGNPDAIRADVLQVPGTIQVFVLENDGDYQDANGVLPHSFNVIVWDGVSPAASDDLIAQAIWNDKPTGIRAQGHSTGNATDSQGNTQVVPFDRAQQLTLYFDYTVVMKPGFTFGTDTQAAVKSAAVALANEVLNLGVEVVALAFRAAALQVSGVLDCTALKLDFVSSPTNTANLLVGVRQIAVADTSRITVHT